VFTYRHSVLLLVRIHSYEISIRLRELFQLTSLICIYEVYIVLPTDVPPQEHQISCLEHECKIIIT
jgi:hypothetical protein